MEYKITFFDKSMNPLGYIYLNGSWYYPLIPSPTCTVNIEKIE